MSNLTAKVSMIIISHLSDVQECLGSEKQKITRNKIDFVKYLTLNYKDTSVEIDPEVEYCKFITHFPDKVIS